MPANITDVSQWEANLQYPTDGDGANGAVHLPIWQKIGNRTRWLSDNMVKTSGNQNIGGIKTFTASPVVPDANADGEVPNWKQVQDAIAAALGGITLTPGDPGGPPAGTSASGYIKHLSGLMEAWVEQGAFISAEGSYTLSLPAGFTSILNVLPATVLQTANTAGEFMFQLLTFNTTEVELYCQKLQDGSPNPVRARVHVWGRWD